MGPLAPKGVCVRLSPEPSLECQFSTVVARAQFDSAWFGSWLSSYPASSFASLSHPDTDPRETEGESEGNKQLRFSTQDSQPTRLVEDLSLVASALVLRASQRRASKPNATR